MTVDDIVSLALGSPNFDWFKSRLASLSRRQAAEEREEEQRRFEERHPEYKK